MWTFKNIETRNRVREMLIDAISQCVLGEGQTGLGLRFMDADIDVRKAPTDTKWMVYVNGEFFTDCKPWG